MFSIIVRAKNWVPYIFGFFFDIIKNFQKYMKLSTDHKTTRVII